MIRSCRGRLGRSRRLATLLDDRLATLLVVQEVTLEVFAAVGQPLEGEVAAVLLVRVVEQVAARDGVGLAREVEALCEEGFGAGLGALDSEWGEWVGGHIASARVTTPESGKSPPHPLLAGSSPSKEPGEAEAERSGAEQAYQGEAVLVPGDEGTAEGFDRCDRGLGSLGDGDVDVRSAEVLDALCVAYTISSSQRPLALMAGK